MTTTRTYGDACGIPRALDRVGERWALLIVRELVLGPKRFTDLKTGLPNASPNVLSQRLRELEDDGVVRRRKLPPPAAARVYELTEWGLELEPVLSAPRPLGRARPARPARGRHEPGRAHPVAADAVRPRAGRRRRRCGSICAWAISASAPRCRMGGWRSSPERRGTPTPSCDTDAGTLLALAHGRRELKAALRVKELEIEGDRGAVERFLGLFTLPEPYAPAA